MSYSDDIRVRVTSAVADGQSRRGAAARFAVSPSSAIRWAQRAASKGEAKARKAGRPAGKGPLADHLDFLAKAVKTKPDITMTELATRLEADRGIVAHPASISRLLCRAGFTYKKTADGLGERARGRG